MPNTTNPRDGLIEEAVFLARDVAPHLHSILITHYSDADTLDTFRPGETDLDFVTALNRAVAEEFAALGVSVFVQRADRAAFRRWMQGRADTAENRLSWVDRSRLLRGPDALMVLGVAPIQSPSRPVLRPCSRSDRRPRGGVGLG